MSIAYQVTLRDGSSELPAATYDAVGKTLVPVNSRVTLETGADFWALLLDDEYIMILDGTGLVVGDLKQSAAGKAVIFYESGCGYRNRIAELNGNGVLAVRDVFEGAAMSGLNLQDIISFETNGLNVSSLNEIWLLALSGAYLTSGGLLIATR